MKPIFSSLNILYFFIFCGLISPSFGQFGEEEKEQIKQQIISTSSFPLSVWNTLKDNEERPRIEELTFGHSLTGLFILGYDIGLEFNSNEKFTMSQFKSVLQPHSSSLVSIVQPQYITEITYSERNGNVIGEISLSCPKKFQGKFGYRAEKRNKKWCVVEYTIPKRGSKLKLEKRIDDAQNGLHIWTLDANGEVWILREVHVTYYSSERVLLYSFQTAPLRRREEHSFSSLKKLLQESQEDKYFFQFSNCFKISEVLILFELCKTLKFDLRTHLSMDLEEKDVSPLIQELYKYFLRPFVIAPSSLLITVKSRSGYQIEVAKKFFHFNTDIEDESGGKKLPKLDKIVALIQKKKVCLNIDRNLSVRDLLHIYQEMQKGNTKIEVIYF